MNVKYSIKRSLRRTVSVEIRPDMSIIVRAPYLMSEGSIELFVRSKEKWILEKLKEIKERAESRAEPFTESELKELTVRAKQVIPERTAYYAPMIGVTYNRISIKHQKTRWGSCSTGKNLNFNCLLMLTPPEVIDSVVVHELCHLKHMDHSKCFYNEIYKVFPEYDRWNGWLKKNGPDLIRRLPQ